MGEDQRPDPDALLAEVGSGRRGHLKVFLGAAPGVGKTYEMLKAAQEAKADGRDVVIGIVETHGRRDTEALAVGLEAVPRRIVSYRDRSLPEMDLDAILARRPGLVLVDELAHSNAPGSRHGKRWQDVEELLAAGLDVHTTLNVQHLDSLNDVVERISGITVRETLPDAILERADEIEVIDVSPEALQKRLREGKVYVPEQAARAITRFFSRGNLTALREMALRVAAERVDRDMIDYMKSHAVASAWPARERLLVCLVAGADAERLVRAGKRMADRTRAPWIVLALGRPGSPDRAIEKALLLAEQLGAETEALSVAGPAATVALDFARRRNVSRIVVGAARRFSRLMRRPLHEALIAGGDTFEITVIGSAADDPAPGPPAAAAERGREPVSLRPYLLGALYVAAAMPFGLLVDSTLPLANLSLVFLVPVLAAGAAGRVPAAAFTSVLAFFAYNYFFTEPRFTLSILHPSVVLTLAFFLIFSLVVGVLGARLNAQVSAMRLSERHSRALYEFTRKALTATSDYDMAWTVVSQVRTSVPVETVLLLPDGRGRLTVIAGSPPVDEVDPASEAAAEWAFRQGQRAGWSTNTLPSSQWLFLPLAARERTLGVLGVRRENDREALGAADRRLLDTLVDQSALILERARMISETAEAQRYSQTEKLRTALLSSVSHDLRTPLVSIIGAVSTLEALGADIRPDDRAELLATVASEAARLNRFIQNLLDMTRLGYGSLAVRREWLDLRDVVAAARERLKSRLEETEVRVAIAPEASMVEADPTLLEQALVNLLDNAARYTAPGTAVEVSAARRDGRLILAVADHGPGIPPDRRERVFDLFWRAEGGDRQGAGTGLGLAIVRGFVEAMGGRVSVGEREGGGALFEISLAQPPLPALARKAPMAEGAKILIVDDDDAIRKFLRISLTASGYRVIEARTGEQALAKTATESPALVILDLGLPDLDGRAVVAELRDWFTGPILILSVRASEADKVAVLDAGADDYVVKPFGIQELLARLRVLMRARPDTPASPLLDFGALRIDLAGRTVSRDGHPVTLTRREFDLLALLARNAGKVVTQRQLLADLWGAAHLDDTQYLRVYVGQLRAKLGDDPAHPRFIRTEPGVGYRLLTPDADAPPPPPPPPPLSVAR